MSATHLNPRLDQTAARVIANAIARVHPSQRTAVLEAVIQHAEAGLSVIRGEVGQVARAA